MSSSLGNDQGNRSVEYATGEIRGEAGRLDWSEVLKGFECNAKKKEIEPRVYLSNFHTVQDPVKIVTSIKNQEPNNEGK